MDAERRIREERRRKRRRRRILMRVVMIMAVVMLAALVGILLYYLIFNDLSCGRRVPVVETTEAWESVKETSAPESTGSEAAGSETTEAVYGELLKEAGVLAAMYDYTGAAELVRTSVPDYAEKKELLDFVEECEAKDTQLVRWSDNTSISHIFFHSLIADTGLAFSSSKASQYNEVMTTIDEFNKILDSMYERGFVLVMLSDICAIDETTGKMTMQAIRLPAGKTPVVLSLDDLSYYYYMDGTGYANRLVAEPDGTVTCEMDLSDGTTVRGAYDAVPILDAFIKEHPDFSYHGAKGTIALTGYNGIFGYRTSYITYGNSEVLQAHYDELFKNGEFDEAHAYELAVGCHTKEMNPQENECQHLEYTIQEIEAERAKAKTVAEALIADGWAFASHTWGHMNMSTVIDQGTGTITSERLQRDTRWWEVEVGSLVGGTDIMIYAYGADIGYWPKYSDASAGYMFLKSAGFNYFCNVDTSVHAWVQYSQDAGGSGYFRQGRRNLDGLMLYKAILYPEKELLDDLMDPLQVIDRSRPLPVSGVTVPEGVDGTTLPAAGE